MPSTFRYRFALCAVSLASSVVLTCASASANLDMVAGAHSVVANKPLTDCTTNAKNALNSVLQNAFEAGDGTGQWLGYGKPDSSGKSTAAAAIHCFKVDTGYSVTITCAAEVPPNPDTASSLCDKLAAAFGLAKTSMVAPQTGIVGGAQWQ